MNNETESEFGGKLPVLGYMANGQPLYPICGADPGGYATYGDILTALADGTPLNSVWDEFQTTLSIVNEQRDVIARHLSFGVTRPVDNVIQAVEQEGFQQASEFGEPTSVIVRPSYVPIGYDFRDFDLRVAMTWKYLRSATAAEVESHHRNALASDNRLVNTNILKALLNNVPGLNDENNTVYPLWNGTVGEVPPTSGAFKHWVPSFFLPWHQRRTLPSLRYSVGGSPLYLPTAVLGSIGPRRTARRCRWS